MAEPGGCRGCSPHFFPNVMLKQLRFKTLVVQFPREVYKMLYFYLQPPTHNSALPSLRMIAKAILNSLWGKFGQNENNIHIQYVKSYDALLKLTKDLHYQLTLSDFVSKECLRVATTLKDENTQPLKMGNVIIASFVTSYA